MTRCNAVRTSGLGLLCFCMSAFCSPAFADFQPGPSVNFQATVIFPANGQYIFGGTFVLSSPITPPLGNGNNNTLNANFALLPIAGAEVLVPPVMPGNVPLNVPCEIGDEVFVLPPLPPNIPSVTPETTEILVNPPTIDPGTGVETVQTQMLQLDMSGGSLPPGVDVRLSPTIPSTGTTTFTPNPGGGYMISSFFDIFTELSIDGGQTWTPATAPSHAELTPLPEPASVVLLAVGMAFVLFSRRHRRAR